MSLEAALTNAKSTVGGLFSNITELFTDVSTGVAGIFKSLGIAPGNEVQGTITALANQPVSEKTVQDINDYLNNGDVDSAVNLMAENSDQPKEDIKVLFEYLQDTVAGQNVATVGESLLEEAYEVGDLSDPDREYKEIGTVEELESEFASIRRPVTELVVHWTESYTNANLTARDINERQQALGADEIQYHYVIQRNGALQRGKDIEKESAHSSHTRYTIAVAFVGGYNTATQSTNFENNTGLRSLNRVQFNTFDELLRVFYNTYPGGQVVGHNDIEEEYEDPGFDVIEYCYAKFGKQTKFDNPFEDGPFTPSQLNST